MSTRRSKSFHRNAGRLLAVILTISAALSIGNWMRAQSSASADLENPAAAIRTVLEQSAADWNRGDLDAFASSYKNSPDILFIGRSVHHGYAAMLAGYKSSYPTPAKRGVLSFSQLEIQPLDALLPPPPAISTWSGLRPGAAMPTAISCWCWRIPAAAGRSSATIPPV